MQPVITAKTTIIMLQTHHVREEGFMARKLREGCIYSDLKDCAAKLVISMGWGVPWNPEDFSTDIIYKLAEMYTKQIDIVYTSLTGLERDKASLLMEQLQQVLDGKRQIEGGDYGQDRSVNIG